MKRTSSRIVVSIDVMAGKLKSKVLICSMTSKVFHYSDNQPSQCHVQTIHKADKNDCFKCCIEFFPVGRWILLFESHHYKSHPYQSSSIYSWSQIERYQIYYQSVKTIDWAYVCSQSLPFSTYHIIGDLWYLRKYIPIINCKNLLQKCELLEKKSKRN